MNNTQQSAGQVLGAAIGSTVLVGPKRRHLVLPSGASVVTGKMQSGDLVANIYRLKWEPIDPEDIGEESDIYDAVCRPSNAEPS